MKQRKLTLLTSLGAGFEYYDFVIYAMLTPWLSQFFFPHPQPWLSHLQWFAIFACGYLARPIGGICFAYLGDRDGRKKIYCRIIALMSLSTLAIACLPGYQSIGIAAPLLLLCFRILQGISLGAELPGAVILLAEHAPPQQRGLMCGIQIACIGLGAAVATTLCGMLSSMLSPHLMLHFGWRILFIIGGMLAILAGYARTRVAESPLFLQQQNRPTFSPVLAQKTLKDASKKLSQGMGMLLLPASLVMFVLCLPNILQQRNYSLPSIYHVMSIGYLWCAAAIPAFAALADRYGRKHVFSISAISGCCAIAIILPTLNHNFSSTSTIWLIILSLQTWQASLSACYFTRLAELFPTAIRYLAYAICYNLVYAVCGMLPMLCAPLMHMLSAQHFSLLIILYFVGVTTLSVIAVLRQTPALHHRGEASFAN